MLIPPSSTFSNTNTNSNDDSVLTKRTPRVTRSSSCDTFSTADVAYDAVPDQCNWNETGIKLFENNENLYDPFNSSIELVHQPHTSSRLNQSSTTISDRSANITTDNSRNSSVEVLTN
ncbi:unnamed protein product [Rotaria magnacalcarata]|uniref:Uncharacterized protein n=1 Tax=Rotaria magnacalcarata TaxID=392030 RepID=A0A815JTP6_9BILA|nr:unnamed protein product [Rotaria magnacalcarata]